MNERLLMDFLTQRISAAMLTRQASAAQATAGTEFDLVPRHLLQLCDAVLSGELEPAHLLPISRCLYYSGRFRWPHAHPDGRVVEEILICWLSYDENHVPGHKEIVYIREWLLRGRAPGDFAQINQAD